MNTQAINVCLVFNENYAQHAAVTIASAQANCSTPINFYLIDQIQTLFNPHTIKRLQDLIISLNPKSKLIIKQIDPSIFDSWPVWSNMKNSPNKYLPCYRLAIPNLITEPRIIYLDVDLVVEGDLAELYHTNLGNNLIAGVSDNDQDGFKEIYNLDLYINSGVILFDLEAIRANHINVIKEAISLIKEQRLKSDLIDQDLLNLIFSSKILALNSAWNAQTVGVSKGFLLGHDDLKIPKKIIHFVTNHKPWSFKCKSQYQSLYYKYLLKTPWKNKYFKYYLIKAHKFIFDKRSTDATTKKIIFMGIPILTRKKDLSTKRSSYYLLKHKIFEHSVKS